MKLLKKLSLICVLTISVILASCSYTKKDIYLNRDITENVIISPDNKAIVVLEGFISGFSSMELYKDIKSLSVLGVDNVTLVIDSPGGDVFSMFAMYDMLEEIKKEGITITTQACGEVASGAVLVYMAGDIRTSNENATFMIHPPTSHNNPKFTSDYDSYLKYCDILGERYIDILVSKTKFTKEELKKIIFPENKNSLSGMTFFTAEEALEKDLVHKIK